MKTILQIWTFWLVLHLASIVRAIMTSGHFMLYQTHVYLYFWYYIICFVVCRWGRTMWTWRRRLCRLIHIWMVLSLWKTCALYLHSLQSQCLDLYSLNSWKSKYKACLVWLVSWNTDTQLIIISQSYGCHLSLNYTIVCNILC